MAEDNKLIFPIGFNMDEGVEKIKQAFETLQKAALKWSELISSGGSAKEIQNASRSFKAAVKGTTEVVKGLNDVELSNVQTKSKVELATKKVAKAEIDLEVATKKATNAINISNRAAASYADIATNKTAKSAADLAKANINVEIATNKAASSAANLTRANASAQLAQMRVAKATETQNRHFKTQSGLLMQLKAQMGMYLSTYALIRFAKNVRDITGEFELQRVSLAAILQDKAEADKIFGQIVDLALQSPFRIKDITSYTKQLAAYRIETDKLFDTTKRLADISAGLGVDMDRLVLAYGQVKAASVLRGQELRQFTEAGIPLVQLLADKFTKLNGEMVSTGEVFSLISQRAVPFRMIEEIFNDMTDAGGIFYDMQKTQAQTIKGVWANLADAYDKMYYEIGQANMGLLKGLGNFLRGLADNWETVYNGLRAVTYGFIAYTIAAKIAGTTTKVLTAEQMAMIVADGKALFARLALTRGTAAATIASDRYMAAQARLMVSTNFLTRSFYKLKMAMAVSSVPFWIGAAVAAAVALGIGIYKAVTYQTEFEKSTDKLNKKQGELSSSMNDELLRLQILYQRLESAKKGSEEYLSVRDEIQSKYGKYLQNLRDEEGSVIAVENAYNGLSAEILKYSRTRIKTESLNLISDESVNAQKKIFDQIDKLLEDRYGKIQGAEYARRIKVSLVRGENFDEEIASIEDSFNKIVPSQVFKNGQWTMEGQIINNALTKTIDLYKQSAVQFAELVKEVESDYPDVSVIQPIPTKALSGLKEYIFTLESAKKRASGDSVKLYDAEEDINAFGTMLGLLEDVAKKYREADEAARIYAANKDNKQITEEQRKSALESWDIVEAEKELAYNVLKRYNALYLIDKLLKGGAAKTAVDQLQEEIATAKDARAAYEGYLKVMNEVRAKQTVEDQLKFAGIRFDVADSGSYKQYLLDVYNRIKNDPNYEKVRTLIEDALVDFDLKSIETELKNKLEKISNDIAKTQKANDFFEKILGLTGDIELSKKLTIKYTGTAAGDTAKEIRDGLQEALRVAFDDESIDIANMTLEQIQEKIDTIPDAMSEKKSKVQEFFYAFIENGQDAAIKTAELANELDKLKMDDFALFGTGAGLDISKAIAELRKNIKTISKEQVEKENELSRLRSENGDEWYEKEMRAWADVFATRRQNEKTIAEEKLKDIASALFAEQKTAYGLDFLLNDIGDKSMRQINEAMKRIEEMSKVKVLNIPESAINALALYGYEIDNIAESELDGIFEKTGDLISEEEQRLIRLVVAMKALGISTQELDKAYAELVEQQKKDTSEEKQKKTRDAVINTAKEVVDLTKKLGEMSNAMGSDALSDISSAVGSLSDVVQSIASGAKSGGWIGAIVGAATSLASIIADDIKKIGELKRSVTESKLTAWVDSVNKMMDTDNLFGESFFGGIRNSIDAASESMKKYNDLLVEADKSYSKNDPTTKWINSYGNPLGAITNAFANLTAEIFGKQIDIFAQKDAYVEAFKRAYNAGYSEVESFVLRINNRSAFANFFGWQDKYASLREVVEGLGYELYGEDGILNVSALQAVIDTYGSELTDAQKQWVESAIASADEYSSAMKSINSYISELFGTLASDIASSMIDSFKEVGDASYELTDIFNRVSESIIQNLLQTLIIEEILEKYKEGLRDIFTNANLTDEERAQAMIEIANRMEQDILLFAKSKQAFLDAAKQAGLLDIEGQNFDELYKEGYDKYATDEMKQSDTLKEYLDDMELYNKYASEATDPEQQAKWKQLAELAKAAFDSAVLEDFNTKLDESLSGIDDNYEKMEFLQKMLASLSDQSQIDEVTKQIKELKDTIFTDLYSKYATDSQKYIDQLAEMEKHLKWAIENGYPELARWIQAAYDTTVLDKWKEAVDETISGADSDLQKFNIVVKMLQEAEAELLNTIISGGDGTEVTNHIAYLQGVLGDLRKDIKDGIWSDYATDAQKYEQELVDMNKDLEWAIRNYPDLADEISDAFNTSVLKNWQDEWDDTFEDFDTSFQKWQAIQQELGNLGTPNITKDEAIKGRDSALVEMGKYKEGTAEYAAAKAAYDYYQAQLILHMKINELLIQQADIEDELYDKYRSNEQEYADDIAEREADIKTLEGIRDQFAPDTKEWEKWNEVVMAAKNALAEFVSDYNLDGLTEEFESTFGDIANLSTKKVKEMLEAFREQILSSDLSDDAKKEALALIDDIYDQLDARTQEAFENIESAVNSLGSLLESFGADENIINSFKGIETAIGGVAQIVTGVVSGNWFTVLAGIAKLISGFINAIKSLITFFKGDPLAGLEAIATTVTNAQNAVEKAIGTAKSQEQAKLLATYAQAISQIDEAISSESGKKDTWWTRLWGTAPDDEAIEKLKEQREEYEKLMAEVQESMKSDFLQTDYTSFSDALADILIRPWDSYMEMMEAVKELTDNTINDIVKHALSLQLQQQVNAALESLYKRGISDQSLDKFDEDIENIVAGYSAYQEALGKYFTGDVGSSTAYDTISRITEAQANSFLGYYQNYLIIMTDMSNVLKRIFDSMSKISVNVNLDGYLNTLQAIAANTAITARYAPFLETMAADIKTLKNSMTRSGAY